MGCDACFQVGMLVFIDGSEVQLVNDFYYISVCTLNFKGHCSLYMQDWTS